MSTFADCLGDVLIAVRLGVGESDQLRRMSAAAAVGSSRNAEAAGFLRGLGFADGAFRPSAKPAEVIAAIREALPDKGQHAMERATPGPGASADGIDPRCFMMIRSNNGRRHQEFRSAALNLAESPWPDWDLEGTGTTVWVCSYIAEHFGTPLARHSRFMAGGKLTYNDAGVSELQHHDRAAVCSLRRSAADSRSCAGERRWPSSNTNFGSTRPLAPATIPTRTHTSVYGHRRHPRPPRRQPGVGEVGWRRAQAGVQGRREPSPGAQGALCPSGPRP